MPPKPPEATKRRFRLIDTSHPVYQMEVRRRQGNLILTTMQLGTLPGIFGVTGLVILAVMVVTATTQIGIEYISTTSLGFSFLFLMLIQVVAGASVNILTIAYSSPMISGEVELQSWSLLRTTVMRLRDVITAKFAATMTHLRVAVMALMTLRVITMTTALLFLATVLLRDTFYYFYTEDWQDFWNSRIWLPIGIAILVVTVFFLIQPISQFFISNTLGLIASTMMHSRAQAMAVGMALRLVLWVSSIMFSVAVYWAFGFLFFANWSDPRFAAIEAFRNLVTPTPEMIAWMLSMTIAAYALSTLLWQLGLVLAGLGLVQRISRRLA